MKPVDKRNQAGAISADVLLRVIDQLNAEIAREPDTRVAFGRMLERVVELTDSAYGFIGELLQGKTGEHYLKCYSLSEKALSFLSPESRRNFSANGLEFHNLDTLFGTALKTGKVYFSNDLPDDPDIADRPAGHPPIASFLGLPLLFGSELVGMIGLANRPGGYSAELAESLSVLTGSCGTFIGIRRTEAERRRAEEILYEAIETMAEGFAVFDSDNRLLLNNSAFSDFYPDADRYRAEGARFEEMLSDSVERGVFPWAGNTASERKAWLKKRLALHRKADKPFVQSLGVEGKWIRVDEHRTPSGRIVGVWSDISESKRTEHALRLSEEKFRSLYELAPVGIAMCGLDGRLIDGNRAFLKIVGRSKVEAHGSPLADLLGARNWLELESEFEAAAESRRFGPLELEFERTDGDMVSVLATGMLAPKLEGQDMVWMIVQDISERKRAASVVWHAENHDMLTNLPNRTYLNDFIANLRASGSAGDAFGFLLLDLDNFKAINDVFGHVAGDVVLSKIGERLKQCVRDGDFIARLGGDEFALVIRGAHSRDRLTKVAERILKALRRKILYRGQPLYCQGSIGVAAYPEHGVTAPELIRSADIALYSAKKSGRNRAYIFDPDLLRETEIRYEAAAFVRAALNEGRVVPSYQPKINLATGQLIGFEALVRVRDKDGEIHGPGSFAEAFQEPELLSEIDRRMLDLVTTDLRLWQEHGVDVGRIAVNASNNELWSGDYAERIFAMLEAKGVPFDRLQIEVTETAFLGGDFNTVSKTLQKLTAAGVTVALDDFGTGYASLTHLKTLPVSRVKVDRSFVFDIMTNDVSWTIVETIVKLCKGLGKVVIAEGIETVEQLEALKGFGCDHGQGFYFSKPLLREDVNLFILKSFGAKMRAELAKIEAQPAPTPDADGHADGGHKRTTKA